MTDPWQDYVTAVTGLSGLTEGLSTRRRRAEALLDTELARAGDEPQRLRAEIDRTRRSVDIAIADLEKMRDALGVELPGRDPALTIASAGRAQAAAVAASQWADQAEATLVSLRRTEQRMARVPAPAPTTTGSNTAPRGHRSFARPAVLVLIVLLVLVGTGVLILG